MKRFLLGVVVSLALVLSVGCNKPSEENCRKAIANMQLLLGTEHLAHDSDIEGEVRRCKGGSKRKAVECAMNARSVEDLRGCDFMRIPPTTGSATGSAAVPATGSAAAAANPAPGSAADGVVGAPGQFESSGGGAAGSATDSGSATGSGSATDSGSAPGSAADSAAGSAATGSGSATK